MSRIVGAPVAPCFPNDGPVFALCIGEAPGPRGADKSGVPFFGDRAGAPLYRALVAANACTLPEPVATLPWDGARFAEQGLKPILRGVALGNAFDRCPTDDGKKFRAPSRAELESPENMQRLRDDVHRASARGLTTIIALGRVATNVMDLLFAQFPNEWPAVAVQSVPHPSAQGLLSAAPDRGRGARLADLAAAWEHDLALRIVASRRGA
jgi:uracil-DNA glycosylase